MHLRRLTPADASAFQALRLAGLLDSPTAFASSHEEEKNFPVAFVENRLSPATDRGSFGAFDGDDLIGMVALGRETMGKLAHKGIIWGMYVTPAARGRGIARALLGEALSLARSVPGLTQVILSVNAGNAQAIHLYESIGFKPFGVEPGGMLINGIFHDEIHMVFRL